MSATAITPDQLRTLWTGPAGGRIDRGPDLPPVTQDDLGALASGVDTGDDGVPLPDQWHVLAEQVNMDGDSDGRTRDVLDAIEDAVRLLDAAMRERDAAIRSAIARGVPVRRIAEASNLSIPRIYQIRDDRR
ncbi:hypothetical protein [Frankia sp. CIT1]|uniref:hypothetical protein n=1 Tax=Frankia sp. CIT1 TaxID=2880974 RepID=UPI001EF6F7D2|nr:hypothetical protein [Frankia sp. CIT1]